MTEPRVCLITGANAGIGRITALELARDGLRVFLACRSAERTQPVVDAIRAETGNPHVEFLPLELGDFASVRACAEEFLGRGLPLHLLINNAGLVNRRGLTASGFEMAFGVNHMGHFLLTELLRPRLVESAPTRVVIVASRAHRRVAGIEFSRVRQPASSPFGFREYATSKLANVLHGAELAKRLQGTGVHVYSLHPGVVASELWRSLPWPLSRVLPRLPYMISVEEGAQTTLHCARSAEVADHSGLYYSDRRVTSPSAAGQDAALAQALWERSQAWIEGA
ncbi:MAG: SDR family oxidoreductase [Myxococcales bacterium]|jgi:NAD(P)-dependent dehydrogenase (short-subunit alcohol dehydrogenase family)